MSKKYTTTGHKGNLVYDIGMNTGQDTANYLQKGMSVIAIEAHPELVAQCSERFSSEIEKGQLVIISGAIVDTNTTVVQDGFVEFLEQENNDWGTLVADTTQYTSRVTDKSRILKVPALNFSNIIDKFGVPYYMKVDIEGADKVCLETFILRGGIVPPYISIESDVDKYSNVKQEFELLRKLGYNSFQLINQKDIASNTPTQSYYEYGGSGDFGRWLKNNHWVTQRQALRKYKEIFTWYYLFSRRGKLRNTVLQKPTTKLLSKAFGYTIPSWYDTHARHKSHPDHT